MRPAVAAAAAAVIACGAPAVSAQEPAGRFAVAIGAGLQAAAPQLDDRFTFERFVEEATADVDYGGDSGFLADLGLSVRLRGSLGAGVSTTYFRRDGGARVRARIPHPFVFGRPREIEGDAGGLSRTDVGVHVHLRYTRALTRRIRATLTAGPSFFRVNQELVDEVLFSHAFPFDEAAYTGVHTRRAKGSGVGFHAGLDAAWVWTPRVGLGGLVRYARGSADVRASGGRDVKTDAGGLQASAGLRLFF